MSSIYRIIYNSDLGVDTTIVRKIPCIFTSWIEQFYLPWDVNAMKYNQNRYDENRNYLY